MKTNTPIIKPILKLVSFFEKGIIKHGIRFVEDIILLKQSEQVLVSPGQKKK